MKRRRTHLYIYEMTRCPGRSAMGRKTKRAIPDIRCDLLFTHDDYGPFSIKSDIGTLYIYTYNFEEAPRTPMGTAYSPTYSTLMINDFSRYHARIRADVFLSFLTYVTPEMA